MLGKVSESPVGKAAIAAIAVLAVLVAVFVGIKVSKGDNASADPKLVKESAQKQVDVIKNNPNLDPALKAQLLSHYEGMAGGSQKGAGGPPPSGG